MTELDYSRLIAILTNPPKVEYPVILPDFFVDHFVLVPEFEVLIDNLKNLAHQGGGNLLGNEQFIRRGGNCVNTASALLSLGLSPKMVVTTDEYGASLLKALAPKGLDFAHVHTNGRLSSTVSIETEFEGKKVNLMISDSGSASNFKFSDLTPADIQLINGSGLVALVNLNHNKYGADLAYNIFKMIKESAQAITFMDIGDPSDNTNLIEGLVKNVINEGLIDVLSLNESEVGWLAWVLSGRDERWRKIVNQPEKWIPSAKMISEETGVRILLHSQYFAANILGNEIVSVPTFDVKSRVLCGAGDAWNAGLIYGLLLDLQQMDQLILANTVAALYISSNDSKPPSLADVIHYLKSKPARSSNGNKLLKM